MMTYRPSTDRYSAAEVSACGRYRYRLTRAWDSGLPRSVWIMLNPSTADARADDPTIRRCMSFAELWGYGGIEVVNVFPWRATDPRELVAARDRGEDIVSREWRDIYIRRALRYGNVRAIAAWGAHRLAAEEWPTLPGAENMLCLGVTKNGAPRHPLYLRADAKLETWHGLATCPPNGGNG